jgi:hypothetical protein
MIWAHGVVRCPSCDHEEALCSHPECTGERERLCERCLYQRTNPTLSATDLLRRCDEERSKRGWPRLRVTTREASISVCCSVEHESEVSAPSIDESARKFLEVLARYPAK